MQKLRTIIADDADGFNENLAKQVAIYCPTVEIIDKAKNLTEAEDSILKLKPDLVIFDVHFGGPTCFDLLDKLRKSNKLDFQIIFLTGYLESDYIIKAFQYSALQYFTKPIDYHLLIEVINKAIEIKNEKISSQTPEQVQVLMQNLKEPIKNPETPILIKQEKKNFVRVLLKEIVYIHSDENKTDVCLLDGRNLKSVNSIGQYDKMGFGRHFVRISQSCIVNMNHVTHYSALKRAITLLDDVELIASKQGDKDLRKWFGIKNDTNK